MKRLFLTLVLLVTAMLTATAQYFPVDTARLNNAYKVLMSGERTSETEMEFLEAYPTTWLEFYMTYSFVYNEPGNDAMCDMCSEHIATLMSLTHINDTIQCKKIVDLTIGMKETGECTGIYQDYLVGYILNNDELVLNYLSKLRKGHQMQFWQFCWSTVTECDRFHHFEKLYHLNKQKYPEQMEISYTAFKYFYDGINYPILLPHNYEEYKQKYDNRNYKHVFNGYRDGY